MPDQNNVLIVQSGGCTAVMNRSLAGVAQMLFESPAFGEVFGALHGLEGVLEEAFIDLRRRTGRSYWSNIANTPGAALGSGRRSLRSQDMPIILKTLLKHGIGYLFFIGGNDSAETAHRIAEETIAGGQDVAVVQVPKTIDNDLVITDHTPGYGSAARFVALATMGAGMDAESMGRASPITVLEVMGRDAGWLAASSALGKRSAADAPHYICLPEVPFDQERFLCRMEDSYRRWGFAVAVTAENTQGASGPLGGQAEPFFTDDFGHKYYEGPGRYLAQLLSRELKVRARFEKPGTIQRSLMDCVSRTDAEEAMLAGRAAVGYALEGYSGYMVTLERRPGPKYECTTGLAPLESIAGKVKSLPPGFIDASSGLVTEAYLEYARPLVGRPLPRHARLMRAAGRNRRK